MHASILKYFAAVARLGSIRKASEELHIATSALSRQIKKLEDELGITLFERLPEGLRLTGAGRIVLRHARSTLQNYEVMRGELGDLEGKITGRIPIACLDSLVISFLPQYLMEFIRRHPAVDFRVRTENYTNIFRLVADDEVDIGITFDIARPGDIKLLSSVRMPIMAIVARGHPLARMSSVTLEQCAQFKLLLQLDNNVTSRMFSLELGTLERNARALIATNNQMLLKPLIISGEGVAFYTPLGFHEELLKGDVVAVPIAGVRTEEARLGVVVPRVRKLPHASEVMAAFLADRLAAFAAKIDEIVAR
ncbi:LysR family transcriptional regulator [Rhizobium puerariae]|uniref:LysR family transcriptional regulator n=1 Tax=Rhizobium puerariae TaxID=1585791 RepID=A0ABV6AGH7_9HYPH